MEDEEEEMEIPHLFTCPISLQIMRDPVTAVTGITYDRESIEHWLFSGGNTTCPVTKQPLPQNSDLTPNHTLRRLIQAWSSTAGDRIPTPKPPLNKPQILSLLKVNHLLGQPELRPMAILAAESHRNRTLMAESGVPSAVLSFLSDHRRRRDSSVEGLEDALEILRLVPPPPEASSSEVVDMMTWVLSSDSMEARVRVAGLAVAEAVVEAGPDERLARLRPEFLAAVIRILREANRSLSTSAETEREARSAIRIILRVAPYANQVSLSEAGGVEELVEAEISASGRKGSKKKTEAIFGALRHLCGCAEGRARLAGGAHAGGVAVVAARIGKVSAAVDAEAVAMLTALSTFTGTRRVVREMAEVGAVRKLCFLLQIDSDFRVKEKVRHLLKAHSKDWKGSSCFDHFHYSN